MRLGVSLYHVHIKRWLREFPQEQFLFLRTDDLAINPVGVLKKVWDFLGVVEQKEDDIGDLLHNHINKSNASSRNNTMDANTETMLRKFFQPHNDALAELLGDDGFRWAQV